MMSGWAIYFSFSGCPKFGKKRLDAHPVDIVDPYESFLVNQVFRNQGRFTLVVNRKEMKSYQMGVAMWDCTGVVDGAYRRVRRISSASLRFIRTST